MRRLEVSRSEVWLQEQSLNLELSASLFGAGVWEAVKEWFGGSRERAWLRRPFEVMTAERQTAGSPRWKQVAVDGLSWLIFVLLVPARHALVGLWQVIEWEKINEICQDCYQNGQRGQRAWAPAQLFALLMLLFVLPVASERGLLQLVAIVPLYRWFCGFGLFSKLPDHSMLYTFRRRVGVERFEAILSWVVNRCQQQGLIGNELLFFDMMGVPASARAWSPYERAVLLTEALLHYLELAEQGQAPPGQVSAALGQLAAEIAIEVLDNKALNQDTKSPQRVLKSLERWRLKRQQAKGVALWEMGLAEAVQTLLSEESLPAPPPARAAAAQRAWLKKVGQALKARLPQARGDLEAGVAWVNRVTVMCGYWLGFLVDRTHHVITAVRVSSLNNSQRQQMIPALDSHQQRVGHYPKAVAADSAQDYDLVHRALDKRQIKGHIASRDHQGQGGGWGAAHFIFDATGQLLCPLGVVLQPGNPRPNDGRVPYRASGCAGCAHKTACLPKGQQPDGPRLIYLEPAAHHRWQQNRQHTQTEAYKQAQSRRFVSEGLFGLARRLYGADKMPYRSTAMNQIAGLLIGSVLNWVLLRQQRSPT